jgi:hypothetical protein
MTELDSQPKSVQALYSWYNQEQLYVNRRYQRKLVWTLVEKQKLVESVLRGFPVPAILLAERDKGGYEIIDGLQRLHSLMSFIDNSFPTLDGKYFDVTQFPTAQSRAGSGVFEANRDGEKLGLKDVSSFLDYSTAISVMRGASEIEIDDVFARINTYGHQLSDQERRQAGVQDAFSVLVRELACAVRGDVSFDTLPLAEMPSISIDLPKMKHGYAVTADEVLWVKQGILRSTDLRDSLDEQSVADIAASIIGGHIIERSKAALDRVYDAGHSECTRIDTALREYGQKRFSQEFKYCLEQIVAVCESDPSEKLREVLFEKRSTNAFPALFAVLVIAFHESLVAEKKKIVDLTGVRNAVRDLNTRIDTNKGSTSTAERRKNVDVIKGLISLHLEPSEFQRNYGADSTIDIEGLIRRSVVEHSYFELKQGLLRLDSSRGVDDGLIPKVVRTICAIANSGSGSGGAVIVGVTDTDQDADQIEKLDRLESREVGQRRVVGVAREAKLLRETPEKYFARWKNGISGSGLSSPLKEDVLSNIYYHNYYGLGLVVINVPGQKSLSYVENVPYLRSGAETLASRDHRQSAELGMRFS